MFFNRHHLAFKYGLRKTRTNRLAAYIIGGGVALALALLSPSLVSADSLVPEGSQVVAELEVATGPVANEIVPSTTDVVTAEPEPVVTDTVGATETATTAPVLTEELTSTADGDATMSEGEQLNALAVASSAETTASMPLEDITTDRGPFDNNDLIDQAIQDASDNPDVIAASTFTTVDAATKESTPGASLKLAWSQYTNGNWWSVDFSSSPLSKEFDNYILETIYSSDFDGTDADGNSDTRFVMYEVAAPSGYYKNPITIIMVGGKDGYYIKSYYNGTGDIQYYHPVILDTLAGSGNYFDGNNPPQFLIPHTKIIDEVAEQELKDAYTYTDTSEQAISFEQATDPSNPDFDSYFNDSKFTSNVIVTTNDFFTKENIGGSVYHYTTLVQNADGVWEVSDSGTLDINTSGDSVWNDVYLTSNMRIVLEEITSPTGYYKNPVIITIETSDSSPFGRMWSVNYFKNSQADGYYLDPEIGPVVWDLDSTYGSLVIPHLPLDTFDKPETPVDPEEPTVPEEPANPSTPETPASTRGSETELPQQVINSSDSVKESIPVAKASLLPNTGERSHQESLIGLILLAIGLVFGFLASKGKSNKNY